MMMMADAMLQIHTQHKANKMYGDHQQQQQQQNNKPRNTLPRLHANAAQMTAAGFKRGTSFIVGQKLRESKWFKHDEIKIVCAVLESGFIIERREEKGPEGSGVYAVVLWVPGYEKSKDPYYITVYTWIGSKDKCKVQALNLTEFWLNGTVLRINNKNDKTDTPNSDEDVKKQLKNAEKRKFHNTEHFAYFCRYEKPEHQRTKKITEMKWSPSSILAKFRTLSGK